jgi:Tfp pilus assembly protein PilN
MSTLNLLPDDYLRRRNQRRANFLCFILFIFVMVGVGVASIASRTALAKTRELQEQVAADYAEGARLIGEMQQLEEKKRTLLTMAEETASLMERVPRSYLLAVITNSRPDSVSLYTLEFKTKVKGSVPPPAPTKPSRRAKKKGRSKAKVIEETIVQVERTQWVEVTLTGVAEDDVDVARYIATLARHPLLRLVDLIESKEIEIDSTAMRAFKLEMKTVPNADVIDVKEQLLQEQDLAAQRAKRSES